MWWIIFVFGLGLVRELIAINYYKAVYRHLAFMASILSLAIGVMDIYIIARIVIDRNIALALSYLMGGAIGSYMGLKVRK